MAQGKIGKFLVNTMRGVHIANMAKREI